MVVAFLLASDFPSENPRARSTQLSIHITVGSKLKMNNTIRKILYNSYFKIVFGIVFGIILISVFINKNSFLGIFAIIGILFIIYNLISLINLFNGKKTSLKIPPIGAISSVLTFLLVIGLFSRETKFLENTLKDTEIFSIFGFYGLCSAALFVFINYKYLSKKIDFSTIILSLIFFPLLFIFVASFINRHCSENVTISKKYPISNKEKKIDEDGDECSQYLIYLNIENKKEKFEIPSSIWNELDKGDTIYLDFKRGFFGYEFVERFKLKPTANNGYN